MNDLKKKLSRIIYEDYQNWFADRNLPLRCSKGCADCCSVNVKITAIEGEMIYDFIQDSGREQWFTGVLTSPVNNEKIHLTTNGFAKACLDGDGHIPQEVKGRGQCPFLVDKTCAIYEARPFSCRCFVSTVNCASGSSAAIPSLVLSASTVMMQVLEHIGQREYWGNMQDVLIALSDLPAHKSVRKNLPGQSLEMQARARLLSGQPIPGFLIEDKEYAEITDLLGIIFNRSVNGKRVEDILNGS